MIRSVPISSYSLSPLLLEANNDLHSSRSSTRIGSSTTTTICCSSRNNDFIPKLEPFSRSKFDRVFKDPPLIQKSENELADYCSTLEGDPSYSCWRAYFELKDLELQLLYQMISQPTTDGPQQSKPERRNRNMAGPKGGKRGNRPRPSKFIKF